MKETVILLTAVEDAVELRRRITEESGFEPSDGSLPFSYLSSDGCSYGIDLSQSVLAEYDDEERDTVSSQVGEIEAILVEYPNVACLKMLLRKFLHGLSGVLDTNYDEFIPYDEVLRRTRDENWDPRRPLPEAGDA